MSSSSWNIRIDKQPDDAVVKLSAFTTEGGDTIVNCPVAYNSWGVLNERGDNCVIVCHALTGNTDAADWWGELIGPGSVLDTDEYFVVCLNVPGSPYGTVSPISIDDRTGERYGPRFPKFTIRDTVALHRAALESIGVTRVQLAVGGSLGGMQASEWAFIPDFVERIVAVACGPSHSPWCIGWSTAQRLAIQNDAKWRGGNYDINDQPESGLELARQIAMMTYRAFGEFDSRFGREKGNNDERFAVQTYLDHHGKKLVTRFDANCYVALTHLMDSHDISRDRDNTERTAPALVIGISSDVLYPTEEQERLAELIAQAQYEEVESVYGHDGFLIEQKQISAIIRRWLHNFTTAPIRQHPTTSARRAVCDV